MSEKICAPPHPEPTTLSAGRPWRPALWLSLLILPVALGWALLPEWFASHDPLTGQATLALQPPSSAHWFGTDHLGRDLYSRTVHGASVSLLASSLAVSVALLGGTLLGVAGGFFKGWVDALLTRLIEVVMAIPSILLSMAVVTVLGFGTLNIALAVGLSSIASFARLARGEALRCKTHLFVEAAQTCGAGAFTIIRRHILPHMAAPVVALAVLEFGSAILAVSALSFLGFGAPPPQPEWGQLVSDGRNYMAYAWWYTALPGLVIASVVIAANQVAKALHDRSGGAQ